MTVTTKVKCYVGLGSNLGDSRAFLNSAIAAIGAHEKIEELAISRFYRSKPHGPQDQPDYLNAAVSFDTSLQPESLLDLLQSIEKENKRDRSNTVRWGARTLDLDLLFYDEQTIKTARLSVPHPRICERAFVLLPLQDLGCLLKVSQNDTIEDCIKRLTPQSLEDIKELADD